MFDDIKANPLRGIAEVLAWIMSVSCAILLATTPEAPPLWVMYPLWIISSAIYGWCAYTRRSIGMLGNYLFLSSIDAVGFINYMV